MAPPQLNDTTLPPTSSNKPPQLGNNNPYSSSILSNKMTNFEISPNQSKASNLSTRGFSSLLQHVTLSNIIPSQQITEEEFKQNQEGQSNLMVVMDSIQEEPGEAYMEEYDYRKIYIN